VTNGEGGPREKTANAQQHTSSPIVTEWADTYEDARRWVAWTARRRWPTYPVNDDIWAMSVTSWELTGQVAA
jgi:hypothetical protein